MFTFERSSDWEEIRKVMTHPLVWRDIIDDYAPTREAFKPSENPALTYIRVSCGEELLGYWMIFESAHGHEVHTCLLPCSRARARAAGAEFVKWIWANFPTCTRL